MPIKNNLNVLNPTVADNDEVINIFTHSKRNHFTCSDAKLYEALRWSLHDTYGFFNLYLTTHPFIAVHITGRKDKIQEQRKSLIAAVCKTLEECHTMGNI